MTRFFRSVFNFFCACGLSFLTVVVLATLIRLPLGFDLETTVIPLVAGFAGGLIIFVFVNHMAFLYVFSHELTHWLTAKCFLRETGTMEIRSSGGHVQVERPNVWIVLAPYFIPLYSVIWTGIYGITEMIWSGAPPWVGLAFNLGLGVSYAFHLRMTVYALSRAQADLRMHGLFFSLALIACCNVGLVLLSLVVASGQWERGWTLLWHHFSTNAVFLIRSLVRGTRWLIDLIN